MSWRSWAMRWLIYTEKAKRENIHIIYQEPEMLPFVYGDKNLHPAGVHQRH